MFLRVLLTFTIHNMWGLWDTCPLPQEFAEQQAANAKTLKATTQLHTKEEILSHIRQFSSEQEPIEELFQRIPRKVCQADLGRYILIYHLGGLYLDIDASIKNPIFFLSDLDYPNGVWFTEKFALLSTLGPKEKPYSNRIAQFAFFASHKKSPLLLEIIKESVSRIKSLFAEKGNQWTDEDVLYATGPDVVTTRLNETTHRDYKLLNLIQSNELLTHEAQGTWREARDL